MSDVGDRVRRYARDRLAIGEPEIFLPKSTRGTVLDGLTPAGPERTPEAGSITAPSGTSPAREKDNPFAGRSPSVAAAVKESKSPSPMM